MASLIGTLTAPGGGDFFSAGNAAANSYVADASGSLETLTFASTTSSYTSLWLAIYADSAGSAGARLGIISAAITSNGAGNKVGTLAVPVSITVGVTYWLALLPLGGAANFNLVAGAGYKGHTGETALQDPFGSSAGFADASNRTPILGEGTAGAVWPPADNPAAPPLRVARSNLRLG